MSLNNEYGEDELLILNIKLLGLTKTPWKLTRGMRSERVYKYSSGELAVLDSYTYQIQEGSLVSLTRILKWYDKSGEVFLEKDITPELSASNIININKDIRINRVEFIKNMYIGLKEESALVEDPYKTDFINCEDYINILMKYYKDDVSSYIESESSYIVDKILSEKNKIIIQMLNSKACTPSEADPNGLSIKDIIMMEITGAY